MLISHPIQFIQEYACLVIPPVFEIFSLFCARLGAYETAASMIGPPREIRCPTAGEFDAVVFDEVGID